MATGSIYDIREDEVKISGKAWDDEACQRLCMKSLYVSKKMVDYWEPDLNRGEDLFKKYEGDILSDYQRSVYEDVEHKIIVEPPIMKSPIRALLGQVIKSRRSGSVETEDGDLDNPFNHEAELENVKITMKDMERKTKEHLKTRDAIHDSMVSCYPNVVLWVKQKSTDQNDLGYDLVKLPWNSCVFGPINFKQPDMSDVQELIFFDQRSQADLELNFPKMKKQIRAHWKGNRTDDSMLASLMSWDGAENSSYRDYLCSIIQAASSNMSSPTGMVPVYQRIFQIRRKEEVWVNLYDDDKYETIPESWSEERRQKWIDDNQDKYSGPIEREVVTLWLTVFTGSGLVLANEKHWFQENGMIPAAFFIPAIINGRPSGPGIDMSDDTLRHCVAQIEYLDDMRKGAGQLLVSREGAFARPETITEEANKAFGVALLKKDYEGNVSDAFAMIKRDASKNWKDYADYSQSNMFDNTRIGEAMQGQFAPRQAAIAKENEISQALTVQSMYIDNFNAHWENLQNLKLAMIPYAYNRENVSVTGYDEEEQVEKTSTVNAPNYDQNGDIEEMINDITSKKYRWKISPVDNSPTAKAGTMQDALMILNGAMGPLMQGDPSGQFMAKFMSALDNPILNKAGKMLAKDAEARAKSAGESEQVTAQAEAAALKSKSDADMLRAQKAGLALNFNAQDFANYPGLVDLFVQLQGVMKGGGVPGQFAQPQQPQQPPQQQGMPEQGMVPQPDQAMV